MSYGLILESLLPELIVTLGMLAVLFVDLVFMEGQDKKLRGLMGAVILTAACGAAIFTIVQIPGSSVVVSDGMILRDGFTNWTRILLLVLTIFTGWISSRLPFTEHVGEYFALVMLAALGMMFMVSSENLLLIFVALELASLSLYILAAFDSRSPRSALAGLNYFLYGGMSAGFTLFGISLVYGLTGQLNLSAIAQVLQGKAMEPLLLGAMVMTLVGLGFKLALVPFHLWAPETYHGAPTPAAALIGSGSKVATALLLSRIMISGFDGLEGSGTWRHFASGWFPLLALLALVSMVIGNLAALTQHQVKRLLAFSAMAHAGYLLLGVLADSRMGTTAVLYYAFTYALAVLGAFGVIYLMEQSREGSDLKHFQGLASRSPLLAFCLMVFILSLAGIPPLSGFFGKFYVFAALLNSKAQLGWLWLVITAIGFSALSLYYYLIVLKKVFVETPLPEAPPLESGNWLAKAALLLLAAAVIGLGLFPDLLLERLLHH